MGDLHKAFLASFPSGMQFSEPMQRYFAWVERQGLWRTDNNFVRLIDPSQERSAIYLTPVDDRAAWWMKSEDTGWMKNENADITGRLAPFCRTGTDGSYAAFWRDETGQTQIVHMGSGSGSTMVGLLGKSPLDFLRLLAIGYEELC